MYVEELIQEDLVTIEAAKGGNVIKMETAVVEVSSDKDKERLDKIREKLNMDHFVLIQALKDEEYILDFSDQSVTCSAVAVHGNKTYQWKHVGLAKMKFHDLGVVHLMVAGDEAKSFNRRSEYRLPLSCEASFQIKDVEGQFRCIVRDISVHGIGIMVNGDTNLDRSSVIHVGFTYEGTSFDIQARVIRKVNSNNRRVLIGCLLSECNVDLAKFINAEQSKRMRVNN